MNLQRDNESSFPAQVWQAIIDLDFISHFTTWFFRLVSRISELIILLASAYIATSAAIPAIKMPFCFDASMIVLVTAPDFVGPGALATGVIKRSKNEESAGLYITMGIVFCGLITAMILTTFVWKLDSTGASILTGLRCLAGIAYGVLTRITDHKHSDQAAQTEHTALSIEDIKAEVTARVKDELSTLRADLVKDLASLLPVQEVVITEEGDTQQNTLPMKAQSLDKMEQDGTTKRADTAQDGTMEQTEMERSTNKNVERKQDKVNRVKALVEQHGTVSLTELSKLTGYSKQSIKRYLDEINGTAK
jgi:hypothetical protein